MLMIQATSSKPGWWLKAFGKKHAFDHFDTYTPVTRIKTKLFVAIASSFNIVVYQMM